MLPTSWPPARRPASATSACRSDPARKTRDTRHETRDNSRLTASWEPGMDFLLQLWHTLRDLSPEAMNAFAQATGPWLYAVLFAIIFAETGLVATPFLPGDSLLFAVGAVAAHPDSPIGLPMTAGLLILAAVLGDAVNYAIGYR